MKIPVQFSLRTLLEVIVFAAFICALVYARAPSANNAGRYQMIVVNQGFLLIFDTQTGKSWRYNYGQGVFDPNNPQQ